MTSRYKSFVSVARERSVGGVDGSESESSESERPEGSSGGVGSRTMGSGSAGNM
jgi:hypothetical protein